ncbi:Lichenan-specific phosphotransferase enzyme iia component, partial [human gut metagenome]
EEARKLIEKADKELAESHKVQTSLIQNEAAGKKTEVSLLLVHAQDHLMTSMPCKFSLPHVDIISITALSILDNATSLSFNKSPNPFTDLAIIFPL